MLDLEKARKLAKERTNDDDRSAIRFLYFMEIHTDSLLDELGALRAIAEAVEEGWKPSSKFLQDLLKTWRSLTSRDEV